ncbi:MAG: hypothetical protein ACOX4F_08010 [Atopobiaceae bacterium]|jgi:hypothetical protein
MHVNVNVKAIVAAASLALALTGCGAAASQDQSSSQGSEQTQTEAQTSQESSSANSESSAVLEDGVYTAEITTDSNMFHVNEAKEGKGELTVKDGVMTVHMTLASQNIVNLFAGTAEDAQKDGAELIEPSVDTVEYADGTKEEVYGFDVPVPALDEEFDVAILGKKGKWYDHKVSVSNPIKEN